MFTLAASFLAVAAASGAANAPGTVNVPPPLTQQYVQNQLNAHKKVVLPGGTIVLTEPILVPKGRVLRGSRDPGNPTVFAVPRKHWKNFPYNFAVRPETPDSSGVTISHITVDGNPGRDPGAGKPSTRNEAGGVKVADGWTVEHSTFVNINYFKVWVYKVEGVTISQNVFDATRPSLSGVNDNVGGGRSREVTVNGNVFTADTRGNAVDIIRSRNVTVSGNVSEGGRSVYLEGVVDSAVEGNTVYGGNITIRSDVHYPSRVAGEPRTVTLPREVTVEGNRIVDPATYGIGVVYETVNEDAGETFTGKGGGNVVRGNTIVRSGTVPIFVSSCVNDSRLLPDTVSGNVVDGEWVTPGVPSWNSGCGVFYPPTVTTSLSKNLFSAAGDDNATSNPKLDSMSINEPAM